MLGKFLDSSRRLHEHLMNRDRNGAGYTYIEQPFLRRITRLCRTILSVIQREWVSRNIEMDKTFDFEAMGEDFADKAHKLGLKNIDRAVLKANHDRVMHIAKHAQSHTMTDIFRKVGYTA